MLRSNTRPRFTLFSPYTATRTNASLVVYCREPRPSRPTSPKRRKPFGNQTRGSSRNPRENMGILINDEITASTVRLLDEQKEMIGVFTTIEAMEMASQREVDLVLLSSDSDPPLCRLIEWSKYKFEIEKKAKVARQKQRASRIQLKELKMRPSTDVHDYQVRLRKAKEEIGKGNHIKLLVQYRGREIQNADEGRTLVNRFVDDLKEIAMIEKEPSMEGRSLTLILAPNRNPKT